MNWANLLKVIIAAGCYAAVAGVQAEDAPSPASGQSSGGGGPIITDGTGNVENRHPGGSTLSSGGGARESLTTDAQGKSQSQLQRSQKQMQHK